MSSKFKSFSEFYPFYLKEHSHPVNRGLHFVGTTLSLLVLLTALFSKNWLLFPVAVVMGYAFAWVGHFFIEKNKPATFKHPFYSFAGDWVMWFHILTGQKTLDSKQDHK